MAKGRSTRRPWPSDSKRRRGSRGPRIRPKSRGRRHLEPDSATRTPFARDRDRIIHATAFRRLKEKTQVFVAHEGDHFRTRLTHSLEVAQIARSIATALGLDADLAETIALAHDLGHPPFGHAGEDELERQMTPFGGFDHNVQTFRVVTDLERPLPSFDGLNLTWETLEGIVKHNGPVADQAGAPGLAGHRRVRRRLSAGAGRLGRRPRPRWRPCPTTSPTTTTTWTTACRPACSAWTSCWTCR